MRLVTPDKIGFYYKTRNITIVNATNKLYMAAEKLKLTIICNFSDTAY